MDEAQALMERFRALSPQEKQALIAAMTPELATILLQLLPPVYAEAIIRATQAGPEQVPGAQPGAAVPSPAAGMPAAPPPGAAPPQGGPGGSNMPPRNVPLPPPQQGGGAPGMGPQGGGMPGTPQGMGDFARMALGR